MLTFVESCDLVHDCLHMSVCWDYFILPSSFLEHSLPAMPQPWSWYWGHRSPSPLTCSVCEDDGDRCTECSRVRGVLQRKPMSPAGTGCVSRSFLEGWVFDISGGCFGESCSCCQTPLILGPCLHCVPWKTYIASAWCLLSSLHRNHSVHGCSWPKLPGS